MPRLSKVRKVSVSLYTGQHNALEIFAAKKDIVSELNKKSLNDTFAEFDRSSRIKNTTDRLKK